MQPTDEQAAAIALFHQGQPMALEAGAGTGKTSTLSMLSASDGRRGVYTTFTKAMVEDAKGRMGPRVKVATMHSLAYGAIGQFYSHRLDQPRQKPWDVAAKLDITAIRIDRHRLSESRLASHVQKALDRFCQSADLEPGPEHFPYIEGIDPPENGQRTYVNNNRLARELNGALHRLWADAQRQDGTLPFNPHRYLKIWELNRPYIAADYLLFDEAQDANPVMISIVEQQHHLQPVWVGDSQQAVFGFTGAINALEKVSIDPAQRLWLTQSFRFGPLLADVANAILETLDTPLRLRGWALPSRVESVFNPNALLTRTNATGVTALAAAHRAGTPACLLGGGKEIAEFARGALAMQTNQPVRHPDLAIFEDWDEVREYANGDPMGEDLRLNVNLIDEFGAQAVIDALNGQCQEAAAQLVISTVHKAKGQEWDTVALADDFGKRWEDPSERRLGYVAATRAKYILDVDQFADILQPRRLLERKIQEREARQARQAQLLGQALMFEVRVREGR